MNHAPKLFRTHFVYITECLCGHALILGEQQAWPHTYQMKFAPHCIRRVARNAYTAVVKVDCVWNVMTHEQKPDFVFRWSRRVHLNRQGRQFSRLLAVVVCASAVVMVDTPCSEVVWRVLATRSIREFHLHFPSRASPCAITFQLDSTS
jgi:hypothetical protein